MSKIKLHRWVRQLHLWVGAWGAIAAVIFGLSGFFQNHRGVLKLPQGSATEVSSVDLPVPAAARASQEALQAWLRQSQGIAFESRPARPGMGGGGPRAEAGGARPAGEARPEDGARPGGSAPGSAPAGQEHHDGGTDAGAGERGRHREGGMDRGDGERRASASRWTFTAGNLRTTWQAEYQPGGESLTLRKSVQSPLAALIRLHKGVGGGTAWILLSDSFALCMVALGISGLIMWARTRSPAQMVFSILGVVVLVLAVLLVPALA